METEVPGAHLSVEVGEVVSAVDLADALSSAPLRGFHHHRVAHVLGSLGHNTTQPLSVRPRGRTEAHSRTSIHHSCLKRICYCCQEYLQPCLHVVDAALLVEVRGDIDYTLLLVTLCPLHCQP